MKISVQMFYQYIAIFFNFSPTLNHLCPLEVENCDSNSQLVVDEDDNGKFRLEMVPNIYQDWNHILFFTTGYTGPNKNTECLL